ncbi:nucleolin-like, partial [Selaginella moellendorffii]|uniref:nucleolin-like n=1 Tax=Selaginella moellendorffii TaxID=88036 RepID=UPI000D1CA8BD
VRFEGDQTEEIKWEELQKFSQKKKEPSADQQDKPGEQSTNSEAATDSEDDVKAKNSDYEREARIQQVSNENAIVITQVQEVQRMEKMDMLADVVVQSKLEVVATKKRPRKSVAPVKLQQEVDAISSGEEADEEDEEDDEESHDEDSESLDSLSEDGSEDEPEIDSEDEDDDEEDEERDRKDGVDDDSDCSLNESDLERLRKKPKKKRKHVLTLQRWRGYKKKRRLAKQEGSDGTLAIKRQKRPKKPTPVDELTRRRQVIAAELKRKLKESCANLKRKKKKKKTVAVESIVEPSLVELSPAKLALPEPPEVLESPEPSPKSLEVATPSTAITSTNLNASESKPSPFDRGIKLRGRKLRKRFNGRVFRGEVADYDRRNRRYKVWSRKKYFCMDFLSVSLSSGPIRRWRRGAANVEGRGAAAGAIRGAAYVGRSKLSATANASYKLGAPRSGEEGQGGEAKASKTQASSRQERAEGTLKQVIQRSSKGRQRTSAAKF